MDGPTAVSCWQCPEWGCEEVEVCLVQITVIGKYIDKHVVLCPYHAGWWLPVAPEFHSPHSILQHHCQDSLAKYGGQLLQDHAQQLCQIVSRYSFLHDSKELMGPFRSGECTDLFDEVHLYDKTGNQGSKSHISTSNVPALQSHLYSWIKKVQANFLMSADQATM